MIEYKVRAYENGDKEWYLNGKLHREDGPAVEYADGSKYWYLDGKHLTEKVFLNYTKPKPKPCKNDLKKCLKQLLECLEEEK